MQSPHILYALAKQQDRVSPPKTRIEHAMTAEAAPRARSVRVPEQRTSWFWQLLVGRRETATS